MTSAASLFAALSAPTTPAGAAIAFSVAPLPERPGCFVAKSTDNLAAFLLEEAAGAIRRTPIALKYVQIIFGTQCRIELGGRPRDSRATVVRCLSSDPDVQRYFLRISETILSRELADAGSVADALETLAALFEKLGSQKTRQAQGLFGEMVLIANARDTARMVEGWRNDPTEHYDFSWDDLRLEVKTSALRSRRHQFSMAQCSPLSPAALASLFVERLTGGTSIADLAMRIGTILGARTELVLKVELLVASALGADAVREVDLGFDEPLALESLMLVDLRSVPAIRGVLPDGVGDVRFTSDVGGAPSLSPELRMELPL